MLFGCRRQGSCPAAAWGPVRPPPPPVERPSRRRFPGSSGAHAGADRARAEARSARVGASRALTEARSARVRDGHVLAGAEAGRSGSDRAER